MRLCEKDNTKRRNKNLDDNKNKIRKIGNTEWIVCNINDEVDNNAKEVNVRFASGGKFVDEGLTDAKVSDTRYVKYIGNEGDDNGNLNKYNQNKMQKTVHTQWIVSDINNEVDVNTKDLNLHCAGGKQFSSHKFRDDKLTEAKYVDTRDVEYISDEGLEFNLHIPTALISTRIEKQNCLQYKLIKVLEELNSIEMLGGLFGAEILHKLKQIKDLTSAILTATSIASTPITDFNLEDFSKSSQMKDWVAAEDPAINLLDTHSMISLQVPLDLPLVLVSPAPDPSDSVPVSGIKLPILNCDEYTFVNETLEDVKECEDALINLLIDIQEDTPAKFMKSAIQKLFCHQFFMDKVSWKREPNRVLLKNSKILECLKDSYFRKFHIDKNDEFFMAHCRQYKNTNRKAQAKEKKNKNCKEN